MATQVRTTDDPEQVLREAQTFLESDPVRHNIILTLLHARVAVPEPGRYWMVDVDGRCCGVVFQSPLDFFATATPMADAAVITVVEAIVDQGVALPGVTGEATTAARFAGQWAERTRSAARPVQGQRIYEVDQVVDTTPVNGEPRVATTEDRDLLVAWFEDFQAEIDEAPGPAAPTVDRRLATGELWMWDDGAPAAMLGLSGALAGVVRVGPVFTPRERRGRGYASALVAAVSSAARAEGHRCILYTDLSNPTSNAIYRAIGYRAVAEALRYEFETGGAR